MSRSTSGSPQEAWDRFRAAALNRRETFAFQHGGHDRPLEAFVEMLAESLPSRMPILYKDNVVPVPICTATDLDRLMAAMERGATAEAITLPLPHPATGGACRFCGRTPLYRFDGKAFMATDPCPVQDEPFLLTLETAGRLVCTDDLCEWASPGARKVEREVRYQAVGPGGNRDSLLADQCAAKWHEGNGLISVRIGNTCPSVYRRFRPDGSIEFQIGPEGYERDEYGLQTGDPIPLEGEELFQIATNVWMCSIMDFDAYQKAGGAPRPSVRAFDAPPGSYEVRVHRYERSWQPTSVRPGPFLTIRRKNAP